MAELERSSPRLRRIFEAIDLAAMPESAVVRTALARWERLRAGQTAPTLRPPTVRGGFPVLPHELIAVGAGDDRRWHVQKAGDEARRLLALASGAKELADSAERRLAMQLRLLLREAVRRGEPLVAHSACRNRHGDRFQLEILAAPLDTGSHRAPAALVALAARPEGQGWSG